MRVLLLVSMLVGITALAGCAGSEPRDAAIDMMNDPAWQPPGQGDLTVKDAPPPEEKTPPKPRRARHLQQPNKREIGKLQATNP